MPTVPRIHQQQQKLEALPGVRLSPVANEETFGGGAAMEKAGAAANALADVGLKIAIQQKKNADDVVVNDLATKAGIAQADLEIEISKNYRGKNSAAAPDYAKENWTKTREALNKEANNDEQRYALNSKLNVMELDLHKTVKKHVAVEQDAYDETSTKGAEAVAGDTALLKYNDPHAVALQIFKAKQARIGRLNRQGYPPDSDVSKAMVNDTVSGIVEKVYNKNIMMGDVPAADQLMARYDKELNKESRERMTENKPKLIKQYEKMKDDIIETDQFNTGFTLAEKASKFEYVDVADLDARRILGVQKKKGGINDTYYSAIKTMITSPAYQAALAEREDLFYQVPEKYWGIDKNRDGLIDPKVKSKEITGYIKSVFDARQKGAITDRELQGKLEAAKPLFEKGLKEEATKTHRNGQQMWAYYQDWFQNNLSGFKVQYQDPKVGPKIERQKFKEGEYKAAMAYVGHSMMEYVRTHEIKDEEIPVLTQHFLGKFLINKYPTLAGKGGIPNAIATSEASFKNLFNGKSTLKPDMHVQESEPPKYDPNTQVLIKNKKTGEYKVIPK